jgi:hypothetical protein
MSAPKLASAAIIVHRSSTGSGLGVSGSVVFIAHATRRDSIDWGGEKCMVGDTTFFSDV